MTVSPDGTNWGDKIPGTKHMYRAFCCLCQEPMQVRGDPGVRANHSIVCLDCSPQRVTWDRHVEGQRRKKGMASS